MKLILLFPQFLLGFVHNIHMITHANFFHTYSHLSYVLYLNESRKPASIILISSTTEDSNQWTTDKITSICWYEWIPVACPDSGPSLCDWLNLPGTSWLPYSLALLFALLPMTDVWSTYTGLSLLLMIYP